MRETAERRKREGSEGGREGREMERRRQPCGRAIHPAAVRVLQTSCAVWMGGGQIKATAEVCAPFVRLTCCCCCCCCCCSGSGAGVVRVLLVFCGCCSGSDWIESAAEDLPLIESCLPAQQHTHQTEPPTHGRTEDTVRGGTRTECVCVSSEQTQRQRTRYPSTLLRPWYSSSLDCPCSKAPGVHTRVRIIVRF